MSPHNYAKLSKALNLGLTQTVLLEMIYQNSRNGDIFLNKYNVANEFGISRRSVYDIIICLHSRGFIVRDIKKSHSPSVESILPSKKYIKKRQEVLGE